MGSNRLNENRYRGRRSIFGSSGRARRVLGRDVKFLYSGPGSAYRTNAIVYCPTCPATVGHLANNHWAPPADASLEASPSLEVRQRVMVDVAQFTAWTLKKLVSR